VANIDGEFRIEEFDMASFQRASGVLLHPSALPGLYGIGTLGAEALAFIDWLEMADQSYWQICPLVPTGFGDSPYQGLSAFAGNPNLIDLDYLVEQNLLTREDLSHLASLPASHVDYGSLIPAKTKVLFLAWERFASGKFSTGGENGISMLEFDEFCGSSAHWLDEFCLFMVLKNRHSGKCWDEWEECFRLKEQDALNHESEEKKEDIRFHAFLQYLFHRQWERIKKYANSRGIRIIGDLPIFVAFDSSDCWAHPELFQLDDEQRPILVAGVPPDFFCATGQLWGNPIYRWERMAMDGYAWWLSVIQNKMSQYDVLRIDHFRGFVGCWAVPFGESTAVNGNWIPAPGEVFFTRVREVMGDLPIIAEDLGIITDDVLALLKKCGYPGMKVLQFAFDPSEENGHHPHNYDEHCVVYTGTHDNDTSAGWFEKATPSVKTKAAEYLSIPSDSSGETAALAMIRAAMASVAQLAITPLQDILHLGGNARFNTPGTLGGNWIWRATTDSLDKRTARQLRQLTKTYGRSGKRITLGNPDN